MANIPSKERGNLVLFTKIKPSIALLTLNKPKSLNSLDVFTAIEMRDHALEIAKDVSIKAVIITGSGKGFCSGADLGAQTLEIRDANGNKLKMGIGEVVGNSMEKAYNPMMEALYNLPIPIIVAVNGIAAGGGVGLSLIADIAIAAESAKFVQVFAPKLGIVPDLGTTWTCTRAVGRARAIGLAILGDTIDAREAERIGLIWKCVADKDLMKEAIEIAERLVKGPTLAFYETRRAIDNSWKNNFIEQLEYERKTQIMLSNRPEFVNGVTSFMQRSSKL